MDLILFLQLASFAIHNTDALKFDSKITINSVVIKEHISNVDVGINIINKTSVDVNVTVRETVSGTIKIAAELWTIVGGKTHLVAKFPPMHFCKLIRSSGRGSVMKVLYQNMKQKTFIKFCPIRPGLYQLFGFFIDPEYLPFRLLPAGQYYLVNFISQYDDNVLTAKLAVSSNLTYNKYT